MKKITILLFLFMTSMSITACDICGCGAGGNYIGILPEFSKRIIGMRYRYNSIYSHIGIGGATSYLTTRETYNTAELWGGYTIKKKFMLMASVPYSFNSKTNQGNTLSKNGIGDISVSGFYQLLNQRKPVFKGKKIWVQSLWVGASVKLPTGTYNPLDKSSTATNTNLFQLGTGSLDVSLNAMYDMRLQDAGINIAASYKINGTNQYDYSYGNKLNTTAQLYYKWRIKNKLTIAPNAGISFEKTKQDIDKGMPVDISGGRLLSGIAGMEFVYKKIAFGVNWQTPLSQNLALGIVKANNKMMLHLGFIF